MLLLSLLMLMMMPSPVVAWMTCRGCRAPCAQTRMGAPVSMTWASAASE
jgi:hypothetical protein